MTPKLLFALVLGAIPVAQPAIAGAAQDTARQAELRQRQTEFRDMDRNNDGVVTRAEFRGNARLFRSYDTNRDGVLSGDEIWIDRGRDWNRNGDFTRLDRNNDRVISRNEWRGDRNGFDQLDRNNDGVIARNEYRVLDDNAVTGTSGEAAFNDIDRNGNGVITSGEWTGPADNFRAMDVDGDGVVTAREYAQGRTNINSPAYRAGRDRGLTDGRQAGREDKTVNGGRWDLEGQRELESADAGYNARVGSHGEYQAGYRAGFRSGYREGFGPR